MDAKRLIPMLVTAACALGVVPAASAASDVQQATSENWSGYVVAGSSSSKHFSSVSGSWVQPTAKCTSGNAYAAFWVGLGGSGQSEALGDSGQTEALEQAGTEADCSSRGAASYFAWYELVPSAPVKLGLAIHPGDEISSKVSVNGNQVTIAVGDQTTGQSTSKTLEMTSPDTSSAEWIAEAPSSCDQQASSCQPLPLTDFGTVKFTNADATASDGHTGTISDSDWSAAAVQLNAGASAGGIGNAQFSSLDSSAGATPSSLSSDGSSFSVAWTDSSSDSTSATGGAGGSGYDYGSGGGYGGGYGSGYPDGYGAGAGGYGYGGYGGYGDGYGGAYGYGSGYGYGGGGDGDGGGYAYGPGGYAYGGYQ
jgi:hypothetical protein